MRDLLLVLVIAAMSLPFLLSHVGGAHLGAGQEDLAQSARRAAYDQRSSLSNSLSHKVVRVEAVEGGLLLRENYYTFLGIPWGWSEAVVSPEGGVTGVRTHLTLDSLF